MTVDVFDQATAIDYLVARTGRPGDRAAAQRVAAALGYLPLALAHAAAYCEHGASFDEYLGLLEALPARELFDRSPEAFYRETVASTWQASIEAATERAPLASDVLVMASYLAADAIPRALFDALKDGDDLRQRKALIDAVAALHRFSGRQRHGRDQSDRSDQRAECARDNSSYVNADVWKAGTRETRTGCPAALWRSQAKSVVWLGERWWCSAAPSFRSRVTH